MPFKRLPNNYGTISKLSGNRRKPYCAKKFIGKEITDHDVKYRYKVIGCYATRREAMDALAKANLEGFDASPDLTLKKVFYEFMESKQDVSQGRKNTFGFVFKRLEPIHDKVFKDLRVADFEPCLTGIAKTTALHYRVVLRQVYEYAIAHDYVVKNYADLIPVTGSSEPKRERKVFTSAEVNLLDLTKPLDQIIMVQLYTGMRAAEVSSLTVDNVDLDGWYFHDFGVKTEAGKGRIVPIHSAIRGLVAELAHSDAKKGSDWLFNIPDDKIPINWYQLKFRGKFGSAHTTHDCRHTFATCAYNCRMNSVMVKLILGHVVKDLTLGTYTHILPQDLQAEMEKYRIE